KPGQLAEFNGELAYQSYRGRNNALGIDIYRQIRHIQQRLCYFSPSELVWFGCEHLPYGFSDFTRLPDESDGIFFETPADGTPGIYVGRIPPYVGTLNPGWDPALPERRGLDMAAAMRDALKHDSALDQKWEINIPQLPPPPDGGRRQQARFVGGADSNFYRVLGLAGVHFTAGGGAAIIDAASAGAERAKAVMDEITAGGGTALVLIDRPEAAAAANRWLSAPVELTGYSATMLRREGGHSWVDSLAARTMYTAEAEDRHITHYAMSGALIDRAQILLAGSPTDWSLFNDVPESAKCGAVVMAEQCRAVRSGAALAVAPYNGGYIAVTTIRAVMTKEHIGFWHLLLKNMGFEAGEARPVPADGGIREHDLLLNGPVS
ncbi:MAG: hypothetical protein FWE80_05055, partial [Oscillospiraceae bacterium]|nr:hypothetical protein [Oscillospiraceae bacterium]